MSNVARLSVNATSIHLIDVEKDFTYIDIERAGELEAPYYTHQPEKLDGFTVGEYPNKRALKH